jgi:hypothetical protein
MVIILSDQTFPTDLPPTGDKLEDVFNDRFKKFCKPHGSHPSGSVILPLVVGSMSHLAEFLLNFYAPLLVETMTRKACMAGPGVNVIPFLPILLRGI